VRGTGSAARAVRKELYCRTGLPSPLADSDSGARGDAWPERIAYPVVHSARTAMIAVSSRIVTVTEAGESGLREWRGIDLAKLRVAA
jgi:hypothetical protein